MSHIHVFIKKRTEDLSFITLGSDTQLNLNGYQIPAEGLDVPLLTEELAENIKAKSEDEVITLAGIMRGMLYTLGIDPDFIHRVHYIDFLKAADEKIDQFVIVQAMKAAEGKGWLESAIYLKGGILVLPQSQQLKFQYGLTLLTYCAENPQLRPNTLKAFRQEIIEVLEQVLDEENNPLANFHLAYLYKEEKQYVKAQIYAERFLATGPEEDPALKITYLLKELEGLVAYERGYEAVLAGKSMDALELLLPIEDQYDQWWNLQFFIGLAYQQLQKYAEAIPYFERVLDIKPDQMDALLEIALAHSTLKNFQAAEEYYEKMMEIEGENPEILCIVGVFYTQVGQLEKAEACFNQGLKLDPQNTTIKSYKEALQLTKPN